MKVLSALLFFFLINLTVSSNRLKKDISVSNMKLSFINGKSSPIHFLGSFTLDKDKRGFIIVPQKSVLLANQLSFFTKYLSHAKGSYLIDYRLIPSCGIEISANDSKKKALTVNIPVIKTPNTLQKISFIAELFGYKTEDKLSLLNEIMTNCKERKAYLSKAITTLTANLIYFNKESERLDELSKSIDDNNNEIRLIKQKLSDYIISIKEENKQLDDNKETMNSIAKDIIKGNEEKLNLEHYLSILKEKEKNYTLTIEIYANDIKNQTLGIEKIEKNIKALTEKIKELKEKVPQVLLMSQSVNELDKIDHIMNVKQTRINELNDILTKEYTQMKSIEKNENESKKKYENNTLTDALQREMNDIDIRITALHALKKLKRNEQQNDIKFTQSLANDYEVAKMKKIELEQRILNHNKEKDALLNDIYYEMKAKETINQPLPNNQLSSINLPSTVIEDNTITQLPINHNHDIMQETLESYNNSLYLLTKQHEDLILLKTIIIKQHMNAQKKLKKISTEIQKIIAQVKELDKSLSNKEKTLKYHQNEFESINKYSLTIEEYNKIDTKLHQLIEETYTLIEKRDQLINALKHQKYDIFLTSNTLNTEVNISGDMSLFISDRNIALNKKMNTIITSLKEIIV